MLMSRPRGRWGILAIRGRNSMRWSGSRISEENGMDRDGVTWHCVEAEEVLSGLQSSKEGLSTEEAARRLERYGPNALEEYRSRSPLEMFMEQFRDFMILVLIAAAVAAGFIGEPSDAIAIVIIVILNALIGFVQEFRAHKAIEALRKMAGSTATVLREGVPMTLPAEHIVPGDIVTLEAGNVVPADLRLTETVNYKVNEASLTGESLSIEKHTDKLSGEETSLGDRKNMSYRGTHVTNGRAMGVVTATGMETELGKIALMIEGAAEVKTPLQKRLAVFGEKLAVAVLIICAIIFTVGVVRGEEPLLMLLTSISLAVAAIPEALPAVVTISLAFGARKLVRQNALIRKLPAVETLGSVTYICSDKTGTLTMNRMSVEEVYAEGALRQRDEINHADPERLYEGRPTGYDYLMAGFALCNDARADGEGNLIGDPTETALYEMAQAHGFERAEVERHLPRVAEIPFDSVRKCMTTFHRLGEAKGYVSFTKGAPDFLIPKTAGLFTSQGSDTGDTGELVRVNEEMAADGMRVLCLCMRQWDELPERLEEAEENLRVLGMAGMMDPPREEAKEAIALCREAGIIPVMITGDHPLTAMAIARRLGLLDGESRSVVTGIELERMSKGEFEERVENIRVYARAAPEQKLRIVEALQERGQFVAMTGDGVNDAPALKRSDIGIAMGITGSDVSKESANMILLDDNFATIVKAIRGGRRIFDNIRKFIKYTMTSNSGEIWTIFLAPFFGLPIPLMAIHILWINLVTDGLPGLALAAEPAESRIMQKPPRRPNESVFAQGLGIHILWVGLLMGFVAIFTQAWAIAEGIEAWQTMVFTVLCLSQMGHVLAIRSESESLLTLGLLSNKVLLGAIMLTFVLQMATIYVPFFNPIFNTEPLSLYELSVTLALSSVVFVAVEIEKWVKRRRFLA